MSLLERINSFLLSKEKLKEGNIFTFVISTFNFFGYKETKKQTNIYIVFVNIKIESKLRVYSHSFNPRMYLD